MSVNIPASKSATITVRTAYVGAGANLVRGFVTTPLERSIAAADGIDYIESQSQLGLSTIHVRLRLNFPAANALSDISARVNQVRADLPPEAEIPTINIEPSDAQIAAMYLSFGSTILEANQVTDYLAQALARRGHSRPCVPSLAAAERGPVSSRVRHCIDGAPRRNRPIRPANRRRGTGQRPVRISADDRREDRPGLGRARRRP